MLSLPSFPPPGPPAIYPGKIVLKPGGKSGCCFEIAQSFSNSFNALIILIPFSIAFIPGSFLSFF